MTIVTNRIDFSRDFTQIPNAWIRDERLSHRARGVLAVLLSHRDGWETSVEHLVKNGKEGRDAIRSALNELLEVGYLRREVAQGEGGKFSGTRYVTQMPPTAWKSGDGKSTNGAPENPSDGFPGAGEPAAKKTIFKNTNEKNTNKKSAAVADAPATEVAETEEPHPAHLIAQRAYDATRGALKFIAVRQVAQWAIDKRGADPDRVENAIADIHHRGKPITRAVVDQWLDGAFDRKPHWQMSSDDRAAAALEQMRGAMTPTEDLMDRALEEGR